MTVLFIIQILLSNVMHDFHVSRCEVNWNKSEGILETSVFIFLDDLELALSANTSEELKLGTDLESQYADSILLDYLNVHLKCSIDNKSTSWTLLGKEVTDDLSAFWIHMYTPIDRGAKEIYWSNNILLDLYEDQKNIVEFKTGERKEYMLMHNGNFSTTIEL